jgi:hypothetical protein
MLARDLKKGAVVLFGLQFILCPDSEWVRASSDLAQDLGFTVLDSSIGVSTDPNEVLLEADSSFTLKIAPILKL